MKIIIRFPNWLGDIVMALPFLASIRKQFEDASLYVIIPPHYKELIEGLGLNVKVIPFDKNRFKGLKGISAFAGENSLIKESDYYFTLAPSFSSAWMGYKLKARQRIGFRGEWRSFLLTKKQNFPKNHHRSHEYLELLPLSGKKSSPESFSFKVNHLKELDNIPSRYFLINVNSEASSRRLPASEWQKLFNSIKNEHFIFIGTEREKKRVANIINLSPNHNQYQNFAGQTSLQQLMILMKSAKGLISNDSGPAHLASLVGTKTVVFFGAGNHHNTAPFSFLDQKNHPLIIRNGIQCSPCLKNKCPLDHMNCLNGLLTAAGIQKIHAFLQLDM